MSGRQAYTLVFARQAQKDAKNLSAAGLKGKAEELLELIAHDPYQSPPRFEKLVGNLSGAISRRINIQHRLVYQVIEDEKTVKVLRMWTHYESASLPHGPVRRILIPERLAASAFLVSDGTCEPW